MQCTDTSIIEHSKTRIALTTMRVFIWWERMDSDHRSYYTQSQIESVILKLLEDNKKALERMGING